VTRYEGPADYQASLEQLFSDCDIFFSAAAVLDFEGLPPERKIERSKLQEMNELTIRIKQVRDIVAHFGSRKKAEQKVIAFAAESGSEQEIIERASKKMHKKSADAIIANPLWAGLGPDSDQNLVWILKPNQSVEKIGPANKTELSMSILRSLFGE
jgi:phosphopantothenoylcysteine decarboxylase/phosphopantothenate--cysteine ligase